MGHDCERIEKVQVEGDDYDALAARRAEIGHAMLVKLEETTGPTMLNLESMCEEAERKIESLLGKGGSPHPLVAKRAHDLRHALIFCRRTIASARATIADHAEIGSV